MHLISDLGQSVQPEFSLQLYRSQKGQNPSYLDHKMRWCRILNFIQKVQLLKISDEFAFRWPWPPGQRSGFLKILRMQYLENKTTRSLKLIPQLYLLGGWGVALAPPSMPTARICETEFSKTTSTSTGKATVQFCAKVLHHHCSAHLTGWNIIKFISNYFLELTMTCWRNHVRSLSKSNNSILHIKLY